jgi:hypothetical protein
MFRSHPRSLGVAAIVFAVAVAFAVAVLVVLPVGPKVDGGKFETSVLEATQRDAPPSTGRTGVKSFACSHTPLSTSTWKCRLGQEVSLLPDVTVTYNVDLGDNGCWVGRSDGGGNPSGALLPRRIQGCVKDNGPRLHRGLELMYKSYADCMETERDDSYCRD